MLVSLLSFNIGVELGQLMVLLLMIPVLNALFKHVVDERMGTIILSAFVAHTAWHWMLDRADAMKRFPFHWLALGADFIASALRWPACHGYTHIQSRTEWTVGPISDTNGALSVVATQQQARAGGWASGRALALKNNVIIDVNTCSPDPKNSAIDIANLIAVKVPMR